LNRDLSHDRFSQPALRGAAVISDIFVSDDESGSVPTIAYLSPIRDAHDDQRGVAVVFVTAQSLWNIARDSNGLAGERSFAVLFDRYGVRVAHTYSRDIVFH